MRPFQHVTVDSAQAAVQAAMVARVASPLQSPAHFLAGGTTLVDLMKLDVMRPQTLVDINALERTALGRIEAENGSLRLGSLVRMADAAEHPVIKRDFPVIAQSLKFAASQQLRNMASLGGNVLQRTRCSYFRDVTYEACNKRNPGSGCAAMDGFNRSHAVLGASDNCIATYPGDFAQALIALDASVELNGASGRRSIPFTTLHRKPADSPNIETSLAAGDIITAFAIPARPWMRRSLYLKIRDRSSYEFALASAAVALDLEQGRARDARVADVRIALGGVATVPWRAKEAEAALRGKELNEQNLHAAAEAAFAGARTHEHNAFKVALGKRTLIRALNEAAAMEI
jgi:xanthine dehydrogenase YagS FAD-binding subunit